MQSRFAIQANGLGKVYRIGSAHRSTTLREAVTHGTAALVRSAGHRLLHRSTETTELWAIRDATFDVERGETVALIGANGSGKSTLLKIIARIVSPTIGHARIWGRVGALLEVGTGFHPELTGRENIFLNGAILGMSAQEIRKRFDAIVEFSGVEEFLAVPIKRYSSGMVMRLAFAVAAHLEPDVLIIDEVLAVGDAAFQLKCLGRMDEVSKSGCTVFFVSHNLGAVRRLCSRAILLEKGRTVADGPTAGVISQYLSSALQGAEPNSWTVLPPSEVSVKGPKVTAVRYIDPRRPSAPAPRSMGALRIELQIESTARVQARLAADISDELGNKLVNADPWKKGHELIELPEGVSHWRFDTDALYLEAGRYVLDVWISDPKGSTWDFRPMAVGMQVWDAEGHPPDPGSAAQADGLIPCSFSLSRGDVVDELRRRL